VEEALLSFPLKKRTLSGGDKRNALRIRGRLRMGWGIFSTSSTTLRSARKNQASDQHVKTSVLKELNMFKKNGKGLDL